MACRTGIFAPPAWTHPAWQAARGALILRPMGKVRACELPEGSLLAGFGGADDYRDCFCREVPGEVSLEQYIERFYSSAVFRPERVVLGLIGRGASAEDIRALASGESDQIAVWKVVERKPDEILLLSRDTNTASWLAVSSSSEAVGQTKNKTKLLFGSWVGGINESRWRVMLAPHVWYSRLLLESAAKGLS
ncbi:hypothetical protein [Altererythrobacter lutimaris]|uniref:DUF2867 domain-containing protein n=1 Tax=Altererythrobacter lutimaris TaxID=2743979 RepID=A0A850HC59_9SPHN|nr:hypothetical protein [Altererythrobacter lutimaris]NVE95130.1 hypothetical protein [Altererythrobacter lutimaris]